MLVKPPLYGSGPLEGSTSGSNVRFVVTSSLGTIDFDGTRSKDEIAGTYTVEHPDGSKQIGTFQLKEVRTASVSQPDSTAKPRPPSPESRSELVAGSDTLPEIPRPVSSSDRQNLSRCLNGYYPCDRNLLTKQEIIEVTVAETKRNLSRCLNGYYPCDRNLLTKQEIIEVTVAETKRNLSRCLNGYYPCDPDLLTQDQAAEVHSRDVARNLSRCLNGYYPCNRNLLTAADLAKVQARERARHQ
jgi:hypothetical protein